MFYYILILKRVMSILRYIQTIYNFETLITRFKIKYNKNPMRCPR